MKKVISYVGAIMLVALVAFNVNMVISDQTDDAGLSITAAQHLNASAAGEYADPPDPEPPLPCTQITAYPTYGEMWQTVPQRRCYDELGSFCGWETTCVPGPDNGLDCAERICINL